MTKPFIAFGKFDLDCVFKVTTIIEGLTFGTCEVGTNCCLWVWKIFIISADTSIEDLPKIHHPVQFALCQGHSSNRHFQWKSMGIHLNRHTVLRSLGPVVPYQICGHLR